MDISFHKYQGTGNDFVVVDNRKTKWSPSDKQVQAVCDRKFGVGADGLILIHDHPEYDFEMIYFNSDGSKSLCGNGSRCAIRFAKNLGLIRDRATFLTTDGRHQGKISGDLVSFQLCDVSQVKKLEDDVFINNGSPHYIRFVSDIASINVFEVGKAIRHDVRFAPEGTNVNFVEKLGHSTLYVRTYERGVENETLSCGTGVAASALAAHFEGLQSPVKIKTRGGDLEVRFEIDKEVFKDIWLTGPAIEVFSGSIRI